MIHYLFFLAIFFLSGSFDRGLSFQRAEAKEDGCPHWCSLKARNAANQYQRSGNRDPGAISRRNKSVYEDCMRETRAQTARGITCEQQAGRPAPANQTCVSNQECSQRLQSPYAFCGRSVGMDNRCYPGERAQVPSANNFNNMEICRQCQGSAVCEIVHYGSKPIRFLSCSGSAQAANPPPQNTSTGAADPLEAVIQRCKQNEAQGFQGCRARETTAQAKCDTEKESGIGKFVDSMSQVSLQLGTLTSANIAAACSKAAAINQGAQAAIVAFRGVCKSNRDSCVNNCQETIKKYESCVVQSGTQAGLAAMGYERSTLLERARADQDYQVIRGSFLTCQKLESKIAEADLAAQQIVATITNAKQCNNLTSGGANTFCSQNPTAPGCQGATDCNSAANANSLACICNKNPNDPKCSLRGKTGAGLNVNRGTTDLGTNRGAPTDEELGLGNLGFAGREKAGGAGNGSGDSIGEQLGSANVGGNQLPGGDSGNTGGEAGYEGPDVNSGYFAGGAGGSGFGGGSGSGSVFGNGDGSPDVNAGFYGTNPDGDGPNLADFLPNGERDPAAMTAGALPDGITGPTTNIWKKINFRYRAVEPTLLNQ